MSRAQSPKPRAYVAALLLLGRRELSEAQVRERLARRGYEDEDIQGAVEALKAEGAIDDARVASAIARWETSTRRRGRRRVAQQMVKAGISSEAARHAIDDTFADLDEPALIEAALCKRLRPGLTIADDREFARLYRFLVAQGFESDRVMAVLSKRRAPTA